MNTDDFVGFLVFCLLVLAVLATPCALYVLAVWNDFAKRWQRLRRLVADIKTIRARRRGITKAVNHHIQHAKHHEQQIASRGARRSKGGGRAIKVSDIANQWPAANAVNTVGQGLAIDVNSRDMEAQMQRELNASAEEYNALLETIPRGWVAKQMGFRPWQILVSSRPPRSPHPRWRFNRRKWAHRPRRR